jgi:hypothetical protein
MIQYNAYAKSDYGLCLLCLIKISEWEVKKDLLLNLQVATLVEHKDEKLSREFEARQ